jgi:hypothetical protein
MEESMEKPDVDSLIRKAANNGPALSDGERDALKQHFAAESDALADACRQRKLERKRRK